MVPPLLYMLMPDDFHQFARFSNGPGILAGSQLQAKLIGNHGNKLRIGGFSTSVVDGVSEIRIQNIDISPVPSHFNGMAYSPFDPG